MASAWWKAALLLASTISLIKVQYGMGTGSGMGSDGGSGENLLSI